MKPNKNKHLSVEKLVSNAKKVLKGRLATTNTAAFDAVIKRAAQTKQRGSK